ncbi:hypothetical protein [Treponema denticola]|uniref:hypothetical protein n=1 Tax=Treponema denticola TaxID=158 RepID=UPI003D8EFA9B
MILNFVDQQEKIQDYVKKNYKIVLKELNLEDISEYVDDYLDFDKYKKNKSLFFDFGKYSFDSLSNESNQEELEFRVYIVFRNGKSKDLKKELAKYTACFYEMFERSGGNFNGIADFGSIDEIAFYNAVEGNVNLKLSELTIKLKTER